MLRNEDPRTEDGPRRRNAHTPVYEGCVCGRDKINNEYIRGKHGGGL